MGKIDMSERKLKGRGRRSDLLVATLCTLREGNDDDIVPDAALVDEEEDLLPNLGPPALIRFLSFRPSVGMDYTQWQGECNELVSVELMVRIKKTNDVNFFVGGGANAPSEHKC